MGMIAVKTGKRFLKLVRRNIFAKMHTRFRLLLFGHFLDSLLIFVQNKIQLLHQKPAKQEH